MTLASGMVALVERRSGAIVAVFLLAAAACAGLTDFRIGHSYDDWIDHDSPRYADYRRLVADFGDADTLMAVFPLTALDARARAPYFSLVERLRAMRGVRAVFEPASLLLGASAEQAPDADDVTILRDAFASAPPDYRSVLVSRSVETLGLLLLLDQTMPATHPAVLEALRDGLAGIGIAADLAGTAYFSATLQDAIGSDMQRVVILLALTAIIVLVIFLRDVLVVVSIFAGIAMATLYALALSSAAGLSINLMTLLLLPLVFCVGITCAVHLFTRGDAAGWRYAEALPHLFAPTVVATLTTAAGCATFGAAPQRAIADMGLIMPGAVAITVLTVFLFVPALYGVLGRGRHPPPPRLAAVTPSRGAQRFVAAALVVLAGAALLALPALKINPDALFFFAEDAVLSRAYRDIEARLTGLLVADVVIRSTDGERVTSATNVAAVTGFIKAARTIPELTAVVSGYDFLRYRQFEVPSPPALAGAFFTADERAARLVFRLRNVSRRPYSAMATDILDAWRAQGAKGLDLRITGLIPMILDAQDELLHAQTGMFLAGIAAVCFVLALFARAPRLVVPALLANFIPLLLAAGAMIWFDIPINSINFFVGGVVLGIIVDDTVYILHAYEQLGSITAALREVGGAVGITTVTVAVAFGILVSAELVPIRQFGMLSVVAITGAWLCNVCLLPVMLAARDTERP